MMNDNYFEKTNFRTLIENDDIGQVEERLNIIEVFLSIEEHVTLEEMVQLLKDRGYDYDLEFVRQCMNRWVEHGFAQKKKFEGQPPRYEHRHLGKHHDHLICTKCGEIEEFRNEDMERLQINVECLAQRSPLLPLAMAKPGENVVIKDIMGGSHARSRLASMGLRRGDLLEIINNNGLGRLIVGHETMRLAMGRGIAQKIMVSLAPQDRREES
jgi:Fur family ferric uptake transcriptional regulator